MGTPPFVDRVGDADHVLRLAAVTVLRSEDDLRHQLARGESPPDVDQRAVHRGGVSEQPEATTEIHAVRARARSGVGQQSIQPGVHGRGLYGMSRAECSATPLRCGRRGAGGPGHF